MTILLCSLVLHSSLSLGEGRVMALFSYDRPATWAQNILCYWYGHCRGPLTGGDPVGPVFRVQLAPIEDPPTFAPP